jgi:uncharacterized membrane protein YgdD (TMEM256/DUF423 family)
MLRKRGVPEGDVLASVESWRSGTNMHMVHSVALLASPYVPNAAIVAPLLVSGIILFSGSCYLRGWTADRAYGKAAPLGGFLFMAAWAAVALGPSLKV